MKYTFFIFHVFVCYIIVYQQHGKASWKTILICDMHILLVNNFLNQK